MKKFRRQLMGGGLEPILFREKYSSLDGLRYVPVNEPAEEVLRFLGYEYGCVSEYRGEKIFDWLGKLGHEVVIMAELPTDI